MIIRMIDNRNVECILDEDDMEEYDLSIEEFEKSTRSSQGPQAIMDKLIKVIKEINEELQNEHDDELFIQETDVLSIKAFVTRNNQLAINIKVIRNEDKNTQDDDDDDIEFEELEKMVANRNTPPIVPDIFDLIMKSILGLPISDAKWEKYDKTHRLEEKKGLDAPQFAKGVKQPQNATKTNENASVDDLKVQANTILRFSKLNNVIDICQALPQEYFSSSMLYENKDEYYLVLVLKESLNANELQKVDNLIGEFYLEDRKSKKYKIPSMEFVMETMNSIIKEDAITKLRIS